MFIRATSQRDQKTNRMYATHRLVESFRNQDGKVRQHTLLNLGCQFNFAKEHWRMLAIRIEEICRGQKSLFEVDTEIEQEAQRIAKLVIQKNAMMTPKLVATKRSKASSDFQSVDLDSMAHQDIRRIGAEHVVYHAATQLKLPQILHKAGFNRKQINTALANILSRLVHPGSELSTHRYLTEQSALDELLDTDFSNLPLKNLYQIGDQLLKHKKEIEDALYQREKDLFNLDEVVTLYDITNTYFEGRCLLHSKAKYGRSKEKRNDCLLVALGMVLDSSGFPKKSQIFSGNVSESKTLEEMIRALGARKTSTIVMDAGIATEKNVEWLRSNGYEYIVVTRRQKLAMPENAERVIVKSSKNNLVQFHLNFAYLF